MNIRIFFLICLISKIYADDIRDLSLADILKLGEDVGHIFPQELEPSDVKFYLKSQILPEPVLLSDSNKELLVETKETKILIHGWIENHKRSWYNKISEEYLKNNDFNIIQVDWEKPARENYIYSAQNTKFVGYEIARFINDSYLLPKNVHLIGHSLGAHVAGFAAKNYYFETGKKIFRISGLDPAGPYFIFFIDNPAERLYKKDAEIVDVIHTDSGFYGYEHPIGTFDIYVNGGHRNQPGCGESLVEESFSFGDLMQNSFCSHARSVNYFTEWINNGTFQCRVCNKLVNIFNEECVFQHSVKNLRSDDITKKITGICFASTNHQIPYLN